MRPVQYADIEVAARVLRSLPVPARSHMMATLCYRAHLADKYRKRLGKTHPDFGSGTLMSAAVGYTLSPRPPLLDQDYLACLQQVIAALQR